MTGSTIVFIHGNFVTKRCWEPWVARYESRGHTCIPIAWPGRNQPVAELKRNPDDSFLGKLTIGDVIDHHVRTIQALPAKPIIIGHSFGGLLTQLMVQRDLAAAAVAIDSVPAQGVLTLEWSFIRSLWPLLNPFIPASRPYYMPFEHFQYTFANDLPLEEQRAGYDRDIVPESRRVARGALSPAARVDFRRPHAPLLMIAGEKDHIMPASLNRSNYKRYRKSASRTEFKEFPGRAHYTIIAGRGWEEVADCALEWAIGAGSGAEPHAPTVGRETDPKQEGHTNENDQPPRKHDHGPRRRRDLLQGLGSPRRAAARFPPRLAALRRRLGHPDALFPQPGLPRHRP